MTNHTKNLIEKLRYCVDNCRLLAYVTKEDLRTIHIIHNPLEHNLDSGRLLRFYYYYNKATTDEMITNYKKALELLEFFDKHGHIICNGECQTQPTWNFESNKYKTGHRIVSQELRYKIGIRADNKLLCGVGVCDCCIATDKDSYDYCYLFSSGLNKCTLGTFRCSTCLGGANPDAAE